MPDAADFSRYHDGAASLTDLFDMVNKKHLLIGCSVAMAAAVVLLGVGAYLVYRALRQPFRELSEAPAELRQPGVVIGNGLFSKEVFSSDSRLSQVKAMAFGSVEPGEPDELCSVSGFGALFLDAGGAARRYTPYGMQQVKMFGMKLQAAGSRISRFQIIDLAGTGECSFLVRAGQMGSELIGHDGKSIWQVGNGLDFRSHPSDMVGGDIFGDGKFEFAAAYQLSGKGVVLYDAALNEVWSKPEIPASHIELMDSQDGKKNIACGEYSVIEILDSHGDPVKKAQIQSYAHDFLILTWPPNGGLQYFLSFDGNSADLCDINGKRMFSCEVPNGKHIDSINALAFMVGKVPYLAILGSTGLHGHRSILCVYGLPDQPLRNQIVHQSPLYQEILGENCDSIISLPPDDSGRQSILVGGFDQILRYSPASLSGELPKKPKDSKN